MAVREILRLGNPALRARCAPVKTPSAARPTVEDLRDTLEAFRAARGFGRGIAAPQIASAERVVFVNVDRPLALVNPAIVKRSRSLMTLWDDCFSFPDLVVKVRRNVAVTVRYQDLDGARRTLEAEGGLSELLQHEIDHLDGVLAVDRAVDAKHIMYRAEYQRWVRHSQPLTL